MTYRNAMAHSYGDDVDGAFVVVVVAFVFSFVPSSDYEISKTKYWRILKFKVYGPELNYILCIFQDCGAGVMIIIISIVEQSCLRLISHIFLVFLVYLVDTFFIVFLFSFSSYFLVFSAGSNGIFIELCKC